MNAHWMAAPFFHFWHVALFAEADYDINNYGNKKIYKKSATKQKKIRYI